MINNEFGICGCGEPNRYNHLRDGVEVMSCNKYIVCPTYQECITEISKLRAKVSKYHRAITKIVNVNAMDYEYKTWAKGALGE